MVNYVNGQEGWTVIGWYRRGENVDANTTENGDKSLVEAGEFLKHVTRIVPTNQKVVKFNTFKAMEVDFNNENITE